MSIDTFDALRTPTTNGTARASLPAEQVSIPEEVMGDVSGVSDMEIPATGTLRTDAQVSNDLEVPFEQQFAGKDFLPAPGLRRVANALIFRDNRLRHLTDVHVEYLWKRRGGSAKSQPKIGDCVMPAGLSRHAWNAMAQARSGSLSERVIFVVWLAADHLETYTGLQVEAALYRQLLKTATDPRDHSAFKLRAPDFVGFVAEIERYGLWNQSLVEAAPAFRGAGPSSAQGQPSAPDLDPLLLDPLPQEISGAADVDGSDPFSAPVEEASAPATEPDSSDF